MMTADGINRSAMNNASALETTKMTTEALALAAEARRRKPVQDPGSAIMTLGLIKLVSEFGTVVA